MISSAHKQVLSTEDEDIILDSKFEAPLVDLSELQIDLRFTQKVPDQSKSVANILEESKTAASTKVVKKTTRNTLTHKSSAASLS